MRYAKIVVVLGLLAGACSDAKRGIKDTSPDRTVVDGSKFPAAIDPELVGTYPALTKSGAGYFYDDVLEYRVWTDLKDEDDFFRAFASYEQALQYSKRTPGADEPLVLVRQHKWIDEPQPGRFEPRSGERITEWQVAWLSRGKRLDDSIDHFLSNPPKPGP